MKSIDTVRIKALLDAAVARYNHPAFVESDPILVPHRYSKKQDIEITAFWTSMLAWGQRKTIINKATALFDMMDNAPYDFITQHQESDLKAFEKFKHRTFQPTDTLYFIAALQHLYSKNTSLEQAFAQHLTKNSSHIGPALQGFHEAFFALPYAPQRTRKHVATPARKSSCKKLCMFLRWMVRQDDKGVDFGIWKSISPSQLLMPLDVHVRRVANQYGLLSRTQNDFKAVLELTENLRAFDPDDPVKYDFALFGLGVHEGKEL